MPLLPSDPQRRNKFILGLILVGGVAYLGYQYVLKPRGERVSELEERLETLEVQNRTARALASQGGESSVDERLALYRDQLDAVEGLIPTSEELPDLLDLISAEAGATGVNLSLIQPVSAAEEDYYTRRVYDLAVIGEYHEIGSFLTRIGSLPRIVTPINLTLSPSGGEGGSDLEARFSIETYVLPTRAPGEQERDNELQAE
ncbi:MAG: type 4a pilus biogenesis protein PilO [Longimicrobiaceae bacterium]